MQYDLIPPWFLLGNPGVRDQQPHGICSRTPGSEKKRRPFWGCTIGDMRMFFRLSALIKEILGNFLC